MSIVDIVKSYFEFFSNKDIQKIENLFAENITLKDWEINVKGKKNVIQANKNIFNSVNSIVVTPKNIYQDNLVALCEIDIFINSNENLKVIDIIKFNDKKEIIEISAYKQ